MFGNRVAISFLTCSKFNGAHSARGVCLAHLGDSTAYVWWIHSVNEDPWAHVAYLPRICFETWWKVWTFCQSLQWHHNELDGVSNHQPQDCFIQSFIQAQITKKSKLRVTGLCVGNSPVTEEFPAKMASKAENVPILMTSLWCKQNPQQHH